MAEPNNETSREHQLRPLVVRFGALGDTVLLTPLLRALTYRYGCSCDLLGGIWVKHLFHSCPYVNKVRFATSRHWPYWLSLQQISCVRWLCARDPGPVFLLDTMPKIRRLLSRAGVEPSRIIAMDNQGRRAGIHITRDIMRMAEMAHDAPNEMPNPVDYSTELFVPPKDALDCAKWLSEIGCKDKPIAVVNVGNSRTLKKKNPGYKKFWPPERWKKVILRLLEHYPDIRVLLTGAPSEARITEPLAQSCGDSRVISVANQMNIRRLMALLERAWCCISVDTGPAHTAAAVQCPLIVLFGGAWPQIMSPVSSNSLVKVISGPVNAPSTDTECEWLACHSMLGISTEQVIEAFSELPPSNALASSLSCT